MGRSSSGLRRSLLVLSCLALSACGAKTALRVPEFDAPRDAGRALDARGDASGDAGRDAGFDVPFDGGTDVPIDGCTTIVTALTPVPAEVLFVFDRSTSMSWALTGPSGAGPTRWSILVDALRDQLPRYDASLEMGALLYPREGDGCFVEPMPALTPEPMNADAILRFVMGRSPGGRTPTAEGLGAARRYFTEHPDRSRARAVVLATDGAPNCNDTLDADRCPCTGGAGLPVGTCGGDATLCLDDARTVSVISGLASEGVPTYVIGIDGDPDPALSRVLTRMALAGERPNPRDPERAYYPIGRAEDVAAAFDRIQASIVSCALGYAGELIPGRGLVVTSDGVPLPRDPTHENGWDLSADVDGTVVLYGMTCAMVQEGIHRLTIDQLCTAD